MAVGSVLMTVALGAGYWLRIHSIAYYVVVQVSPFTYVHVLYSSVSWPTASICYVYIQILGGLIQSTGWPGVVAVMANWFGKGRWVKSAHSM